MTLEVPAYMQERVGEILSVELNAAIYRENFATILRLAPFKDGNQWCVLYGENLQEGIAGFGDTPWQAMEEFHKAMLAEKAVSSTATNSK